MNWVHWSLLSKFFAGLTAVMAKAGAAGIDSNLATAVRTTVILFFVWGIAFVVGKPSEMAGFSVRTWMFPALSGVTTGRAWKK